MQAQRPIIYITTRARGPEQLLPERMLGPGLHQECIVYATSDAPARPSIPEKCAWWILYYVENIVREATREHKPSPEELEAVSRLLGELQTLYRKALRQREPERRRTVQRMNRIAVMLGADPW